MNIRHSELKHAMVAQLDRNSVIANNLANVNSNGYKRDVMFSELIKSNDKSKSQNQLATDFSQGALIQTNNPLDLAISGEGFFTVDDGDQFAFTRDGHFSRGADGYLRSSSGLPVMGQAGWIDLGINGEAVADIRVSMKGDVYVDDELIDRLEISSFDDQAKLNKIGANLYRADAGTYENRVEEPSILQGKIEGSNVQAVHEMVELIQLQRNFETAQKALRTLDDATSKANSLGNYK